MRSAHKGRDAVVLFYRAERGRGGEHAAACQGTQGKVNAALFTIGDASRRRVLAAGRFEGQKIPSLIGEPGAPKTFSEGLLREDFARGLSHARRK